MVRNQEPKTANTCEMRTESFYPRSPGLVIFVPRVTRATDLARGFYDSTFGN